MLLKRSLFSILIATTFSVVFTADHHSCVETAAAQTNADVERETLATQIKDLQKHVSERQSQLSEIRQSRVVAAGTVGWTLPKLQDNKSNVRVKLATEIVAKLGDDYIVLLTRRIPVGAYPCLIPYWQKANDGFDVTLADPAVSPTTPVEYGIRNKNYLIDWIVVRK